MNYVPPAGNAVTFELYAPPNPSTGPVVFQFGLVVVLALSAAQVAAPPAQTVALEVVPLVAVTAQQAQAPAQQAAFLAARVALASAQTLGLPAQSFTLTARAVAQAAQQAEPATNSTTFSFVRVLAAAQVVPTGTQTATFAVRSQLVVVQTAAPAVQDAVIGEGLRKLVVDQVGAAAKTDAFLTVRGSVAASQQAMPAIGQITFSGSFTGERNRRTYVVMSENRGYAIFPQSRNKTQVI